MGHKIKRHSFNQKIACRLDCCCECDVSETKAVSQCDREKFRLPDRQEERKHQEQAFDCAKLESNIMSPCATIATTFELRPTYKKGASFIYFSYHYFENFLMPFGIGLPKVT